MTNVKLLAAGLEYLQSGISIIPCDRAAKQPRIPTWKPYQANPPAYAEVLRWFAPWSEADAVAIVAGRVSGNLEIMDFDAPMLLEPWAEQIQDLELLGRLPVIRTQSGGYHVYYRCAAGIAGNQKLAVDPAKPNGKYTLIETRSEGGYALAPPSSGYTLLQGELTDIPFASADERALLLGAARQLSQEPVEPQQARPQRRHSVAKPTGSVRPGDDFNARGDIAAVLERHGWRFVRMANESESYWRKPGKRRRGHSATLNYQDSGYFYVFSTSAPPFEPGGYSPFSVYALLEHGGDFRAAAQALRWQGYGQ